jgi:hypothetical protein
VEKARHLVGLVMSMLTLKSMPPKVTNTPFVIRIFPRHAFALERTDLGGSIPFRAPEGDELLKALDTALGICLNEQTHGKVSPSSSVVPANLADGDAFN